MKFIVCSAKNERFWASTKSWPFNNVICVLSSKCNFSFCIPLTPSIKVPYYLIRKYVTINFHPFFRLNSSTNSWMNPNNNSRSQELIQTATNLTRKLMAMDKESDVKEGLRRMSRQSRASGKEKFRYWWSKKEYYRVCCFKM